MVEPYRHAIPPIDDDPGCEMPPRHPEWRLTETQLLLVVLTALSVGLAAMCFVVGAS